VSRRQVVRFRGVPAWAVRDALLALGGRPGPDGNVEGPGWRAELETTQVSVGSLSLAEVSVALAGPQELVVCTLDALRRKLMRTGG